METVLPELGTTFDNTVLDKFHASYVSLSNITCFWKLKFYILALKSAMQVNCCGFSRAVTDNRWLEPKTASATDQNEGNFFFEIVTDFRTYI